MAQHYSQLCALLVEDAYGQLSSKVFTSLSLWGRLNLSTLTHHTQLSPRHVRYGLTVLIQQHLVLHSSPDSDHQSFYEVDWNGAYNLMRTGKIVKVVEDRFGEAAGQVISNLLQLGHARIGDLEGAYKFTSKNSGAIDSAAEHINGEGTAKPQSKKITTSEQLHSTIYKLLQSGFVVKVRKRTYLSPADANNEVEAIVKREQFPDGKVTGPKAKIQFVQAVNSLKRKWRDEVDDVDAAVPRGTKRKTNGHNPPPKRQRMNGAMSNGVGQYGDDGDDDVTLESDMVIKVNYEKCNVALRSQALEHLAARTIGDATAKVYAALLVLLERKVHRCYDELEEYLDAEEEEKAQPSSTTLEIADVINPSIDLSSAIGTNDDDFDDDEDDDDDDQPNKGRIKKETANQNSDNGAAGFADRNKRMALIEQHMALLAEHSRGFASKISTRGKGEWRVNFPALVRWLQRNEVEQVINARFGSIATRIVRMLNIKGKLDDKQVANFSLMRQKDIRSIMTEMHEAGFVEAQEVPKDNSRQPSRTLYLWYFDPERCRHQLLANTYKAQARLVQRMQFEKDEVADVVQKAERLDVVGHEDEYLTAGDKQQLRLWREYEEKLLTQLARQDDLVALLRDFLPETQVL